MKALRFHSFGDPASVLKIEEVPAPASDGDVLVQVKAAAINPSDVRNVQGAFSFTTLPRTPGRDFSGVVVSGGEHLGREVWGTGPLLGMTRDGAHAEYLSVPSEFVVPKPGTLDFEQCAAIGVPFTTAYAALIGAAHLEPGETILVVGAAGAVGSAAVQIAQWKQARVIAADIDTGSLSGVAGVIDTRTETLNERARALTDGHGVNVVFDVVGGPMFEPSLRSLAIGGRQVAIASSGGSRVSFDLVEFYHNRSHLIGVDSYKFSPGELDSIMIELNRGFETGALKPPAFEAVPFEHAITSYENVATRKAALKQVLTF